MYSNLKINMLASLMALCVLGISFQCASANDDEVDKTTEANPATAAAEPIAPATNSFLGAPVDLQVYPQNIELNSARDWQSVVAQVVYANGVTEDVTDQLKFSLDQANIARLDGNRILPQSDGAAKLQVEFAGFTKELPINVKAAAARPDISFTNDVMPVFSKAGCNTGSCHGAARGKDGFRLSLYGFDPKGDYHRLTREMLGRRIDLAVPSDCLLMTKATGQVAHTGGALFKPESPYYATLLEWLGSGASFDSGEIPIVEGIEVFPKGGLLNGQGAKQQLTVRAKYSDGTDRDVTDLAYFMTSNDNSATVSQTGLVEAKNRGEAFVMARFDTHTVGVDFVTLPHNLEFQWEVTPANNYIDNHIHNKLKKLRIQPSGLCSDAEFIRRSSLDICGISPSSEEIVAFEADEDPEKRSKLVDQLLSRKEFVDIWVMKWSELLQIRSTNIVSYKSTLLYYTWLQQQIASETPVDQMVRELLSSEGGTFTNPATNYYQVEQNTLKTAENVAQVFMGTRIQCAQCHNHPFDRWTMDDYYGFVSFFSQIGRKRAEDPREQIIFNRNRGETPHPVTKKALKPKFLGGETPDLKGRDRRAVLAEWLASKENPFFARNIVNITWAHFLGRGIVQEVDDVRVSNPPVNQELLDELAEKFTSSDFNFKQLVRDICTSRTYQLSTQTNATNESDLSNFSHATLRRIRAEVLLDVISQITETKNKFRGLPLGARAVEIADGNTSNYFLTTFGRAKRETVCSCEVKMEPNLSQALHLINGDSVHRKIKQGQVVKKLLDAGKTPPQVAEELYMRCLGRKPTATEIEKLGPEFEANKETIQVFLEDLFWALLNSREFVFNH